MPMDWSDCPEAAGPVTERQPRAFGDGLEHWPESAGPMPEVGGQDYGSPGMPRIGAIPPLLDPAVRDRERDEAARRWELRQQVERAAHQAGLTALAAGETADRIQREAAEAADKAVNRS